MELEGKIINFLGDSITEGGCASKAENQYVSLIAAQTGAVCRNYGIGGTRLATYTNSTKDESGASVPSYRVYFRAPPNSSTV